MAVGPENMRMQSSCVIVSTARETSTLIKKRAQLVLGIKDHPFFQNLSDDVVARIEPYVHHRAYEPRQIIFFPDDSCDFIYAVREGQVKISRHVKASGHARGHRELSFRHLFAGDLFGEECLQERAKHGAYAEAVTPTVLSMLRAADFRRLTRSENELTLLVAQRLLARVTEVEQVLTEALSQTVRCRIAAGLVRLYRKAPQQEGATLRITHQEVASLVGSTRETTTAMLDEFRSKGILSIANRRITVLDPAALERASRSG